jgi:cytochrome c oxidase assembly protein subunit 15
LGTELRGAGDFIGDISPHRFEEVKNPLGAGREKRSGPVDPSRVEGAHDRSAGYGACGRSAIVGSPRAAPPMGRAPGVDRSGGCGRCVMEDWGDEARSARQAGRAFLVLVGLTWMLIVLGAVVRAQGAGLACPDWPKCFGVLLPRMDLLVFLEWVHRVIAGLIALLFIGVSALTLRLPTGRAAVGGWIALAAALLAIQIALGGLTVLKLLEEWTVVSHLVTGNLFCLVLLLIARRLLGFAESHAAVPAAARGLALLTAAALLVQMVLGGFVSSTYAGYACSEWPTCNDGRWFPAFSGLVGLQIFHRLGAYALALSYLGVAIAAWRRPLLGNLARIGFSLVLFQILIGVMNVLMRLPVEITAVHSAAATLIVLVTTLLVRGAVVHPVPLGESAEVLAPRKAA